LLGSLPDAALDRIQERDPAIAAGLTILDANQTFHIYTAVRTAFRDKLGKYFLEVPPTHPRMNRLPRAGASGN
jgi:hypothetical protein